MVVPLLCQTICYHVLITKSSGLTPTQHSLTDQHSWGVEVFLVNTPTSTQRKFQLWWNTILMLAQLFNILCYYVFHSAPFEICASVWLFFPPFSFFFSLLSAIEWMPCRLWMNLPSDIEQDRVTLGYLSGEEHSNSPLFFRVRLNYSWVIHGGKRDWNHSTKQNSLYWNVLLLPYNSLALYVEKWEYFK